MTAVQTQTSSSSTLGGGVQSPALALTEQNHLLGVLDVVGLAGDLVKLAVAVPAQAVEVLQDLGGLLSPLDLARLTNELPQTVSRLGEAVQGLNLGDVLSLGDSVDLAARALAPMGLDLSRLVEDAAGTGLKSADPVLNDLTRPMQAGVSEAMDRLGVRNGPAVGMVTSLSALTSTVAEAPVAAASETQLSAMVGRNEATWTLDVQGRPMRIEATLREAFTGLDRSSAETRSQAQATERGDERDHGGHIIGHRFVKDQGLDNLFPQNGDFNVSAYQTLENDMADWVEAGAEVRVTVDLLGGGDRPVRVRVAYEVLNAGEPVYENNVLFRNVADQTFDRPPSSDTKAMLGGRV